MYVAMSMPNQDEDNAIPARSKRHRRSASRTKASSGLKATGLVGLEVGLEQCFERDVRRGLLHPLADSSQSRKVPGQR